MTKYKNINIAQNTFSNNSPYFAFRVPAVVVVSYRAIVVVDGSAVILIIVVVVVFLLEIVAYLID